MDVSPILDALNCEQRDAVTASAQHALVLAGAGSGKTRVLTHRIAWLVETQKVSPFGIVAVTFTNKAANEMRMRLESLLETPVQGMWFGTFHGLCYRLLRRHWQEAGLMQNFQIMDTQDQRRLIKRILKNLNLDETQWQPKHVQWFIEQYKDQGIRSRNIQENDDMVQRQMMKIYAEYEKVCTQSSLVDFSELLLRTVELLRDNSTLQRLYHERFRSILVDEFQDTNRLQYAWIRNLAGCDTSIFVVGDDDQSIYSWRGACAENVNNFNRDFPTAKIYRLERNYRSTQIILSVANALIRHNQGRLGKNLWTDEKQGNPILFFAAHDEREEAKFTVARIQAWIESGKPGNQAAILYRSNAQSRVFEEQLGAEKIPYRVYGGVRFFERLVVKDVLAYLRLAQNFADDPSFERIINMPPRGIGNRTIETLRMTAREQNISLWAAGLHLQKTNQLSARATNALADFYHLINKLKSNTALLLAEQIENVIAWSGLRDHYARLKDEKSQSNIENLGELVIAAESFEKNQLADEDLTPLEAFLIYTALEAGERWSGSPDDCVQLMTLHSAKGLEFSLVFMVGLEEGLFPHAMSIENPAGLEEERRLCYVGITRAKEQLVISYAQTRRRYGAKEVHNLSSRFVYELPLKLIKEVRPELRTSQAISSKKVTQTFSTNNAIHVGQTVKHSKFGQGIVLACEGSDVGARAQVRFKNVGTKWLVVAYANLRVC